MTERTIIITGAMIDEYPDEITRPDRPISFSYEDNGRVSIDAMAQREGVRLWEQMHGEKPTQILYSWK